MFVDYSGKKPHVVRAATGELIDVELFVAVLGRVELHVRGGGRYTQQLPHWIASNSRAVAFFGGVPGARGSRPVESPP